jgi:hypothetical protein
MTMRDCRPPLDLLLQTVGKPLLLRHHRADDDWR